MENDTVVWMSDKDSYEAGLTLEEIGCLDSYHGEKWQLDRLQLVVDLLKLRDIEVLSAYDHKGLLSIALHPCRYAEILVKEVEAAWFEVGESDAISIATLDVLMGKYYYVPAENITYQDIAHANHPDLYLTTN